MTTPNPTTDWIDAEKTKPSDGREVIIHTPTSPDKVRSGFYRAKRWLYGDRWPVLLPVTHWRDFPEPPKK